MSIAQIAPLVRGAYLDRLGVPVAVTRVAGDDEPGYKLDVAPVEGLRPEGSDWSVGLVEAASLDDLPAALAAAPLATNVPCAPAPRAWTARSGMRSWSKCMIFSRRWWS